MICKTFNTGQLYRDFNVDRLSLIPTEFKARNFIEPPLLKLSLYLYDTIQPTMDDVRIMVEKLQYFVLS